MRSRKASIALFDMKRKVWSSTQITLNGSSGMASADVGRSLGLRGWRHDLRPTRNTKGVTRHGSDLSPSRILTQRLVRPPTRLLRPAHAPEQVIDRAEADGEFTFDVLPRSADFRPLIKIQREFVRHDDVRRELSDLLLRLQGDALQRMLESSD